MFGKVLRRRGRFLKIKVSRLLPDRLWIDLISGRLRIQLCSLLCIWGLNLDVGLLHGGALDMCGAETWMWAPRGPHWMHVCLKSGHGPFSSYIRGHPLHTHEYPISHTPWSPHGHTRGHTVQYPWSVHGVTMGMRQNAIPVDSPQRPASRGDHGHTFIM